MRILLVEDDALLGDGIHAGLKLAQHAVDWARDGEAARLALLDHGYDACVLDLGLPKRNGLSVLKDLRHRGSRLPVLILTARDANTDKIAGLDAGADDYLTKPFDLQELLARLRALIRRAAGEARPTLEHAGVVLDPASAISARERSSRKASMPGAKRRRAIPSKSTSIICGKNSASISFTPCADLAINWVTLFDGQVLA